MLFLLRTLLKKVLVDESVHSVTFSPRYGPGGQFVNLPPLALKRREPIVDDDKSRSPCILLVCEEFHPERSGIVGLFEITSRRNEGRVDGPNQLVADPWSYEYRYVSFPVRFSLRGKSWRTKD